MHSECNSKESWGKKYFLFSLDFSFQKIIDFIDIELYDTFFNVFFENPKY